MSGSTSPPSYSRSTSTDTAPSSTTSRKHRSKLWQAPDRTTYALAYPAPVFADKTRLLKHLRPRLYLQLQTRSADGRHYEPFIDVLSLAPPKDPRRLMSVVKKYVKKLKSHEKVIRLGKRDILLIRTGDDGFGSEAPEQRGIERVVTHLGDPIERRVTAALRGSNETVTEDGRTWGASEGPNGSFEFTHVTEDGEETIARWVPSKHRAAAGVGSPPGTPATARFPADARSQDAPRASFNFSLIDPTMRRHAVLATLDPSRLQIKDTYHEPTSIMSGSRPEDAPAKVVDVATRTLILATAVWLDLHLGWSPAYEATRSVDRSSLQA